LARINIGRILKYLLFFSIGIVIFYFVYRGQDPGEIWEGVMKFKTEWILLSYFFSIFSHFLRALRWRMLINPLGYYPSLKNSFLAILIMYLANFVFPRLGEVSRCGVLTKYEKVPFAEQVGTVVTERMTDLIILILIILAVVIGQFDFLTGFIENNRLEFGFDKPLLESWLFWGLFLTFIIISGGLFYFFRDKIKSMPLFIKLFTLLRKFMDGFMSIRKLKNAWLYIFYSVLIYFFYFMMTYTILMGYGPTSELGANAAFLVMAMGSIGMVIPVQGGFGTYHFFAVETMVILGLSRADGQLAALVLHGSTTILMIFIGLAAMLLLPLVNQKVEK